METIGELLPFAKEMLYQGPSRNLLKIYMLGSTLAVLGAVGGLVETVFLPSGGEEETYEMMSERAPVEHIPVVVEKKKLKKKVKKVVAKPEPSTVAVGPEVEDVGDMVDFEAKGKQMANAGRRNSFNRVYAS